MKNILSKLHLIMSEIKSIEKDKKNEMQHYEYTSEYAIKKTIQPLLKKHKVVFFPTKTESIIVGEATTSKGGKLFITKTSLTFTFYDVDSAESISGVIEGTGSDVNDKGIYKALTGAIKYALTSTFLIPTGEDAEKADPKNDPTDTWEQDMTSTVRTVTEAPKTPDESICPIHKIKMNKFTKGTKSWYSHSFEGQWCSGKGYQSPTTK